MELTITSVLSLFCLLALSAGVFYTARRFNLPYTVLLVAVGVALVPIVRLPGLAVVFGFLDDLQLTPELLFLMFLPVLIFESGYSMSIRTMLDHAWTILLLAVVGLLISAFGVAGVSTSCSRPSAPPCRSPSCCSSARSSRPPTRWPCWRSSRTSGRLDG